MRIFDSSQQAQTLLRKGAAVTIGNYDGLHLGHRSIITQLKAEAKKRKLLSVVYTFEPHPVKVLAPAIAPPLINTREQKIEFLKNCGVDIVIFEKFNKRFSHLSPEIFFKKVLIERLNAGFIIVGHDFTFGSKRQGNIETLEHFCHTYKIGVRIVEPCLYGETLVSSSLIRRYVTEGKVKEVIPLLTRPFFIEGMVVRGAGRGKTLGIPTLNLRVGNELLPGKGVYATRVRFGNQIHPSITNIGNNPTFGQNPLSIETHVFLPKKNAYGKKVRLFFLERIRDEMTFKNSADLVRQIQKDIRKAKRILSQA